MHCAQIDYPGFAMSADGTAEGPFRDCYGIAIPESLQRYERFTDAAGKPIINRLCGPSLGGDNLCQDLDVAAMLLGCVR